MGLIKFLVVVVLASALMIVLSFFWPTLTSEPRPSVLSYVHSATLQSQYGSTISNVLGIEDSLQPEPLNLKSVAQNAVENSVSHVGNYVSGVVVREASKQLVNQITAMSPEQKLELQNLLCAPEQTIEVENIQ